jgi:hypothetical protein
LHVKEHAVDPPHVMLHCAVPSQTAVQPPAGQSMLHVVSPVHVSVEPVPSATFASAPPDTVTLLSAPVLSEQLLEPEHVDTQFDWHVATQSDCP